MLRKEKKILKKSPQRIVLITEATSNDDISSIKSINASNDKDLILNITDFLNRKKAITKNNKILDDFCCSNSGTYLFQISPLKKN